MWGSEVLPMIRCHPAKGSTISKKSRGEGKGLVWGQEDDR